MGVGPFISEMERATTNLLDHPRQKYLWEIQRMIQIGHKIKKIVILVLVGDPFKPEVIRASANLFEKRTRNRMGEKNYQNQI